MIIYKTRWFNRWARKQGLDNYSLCTAVREMAEGLYEALKKLAIELLSLTSEALEIARQDNEFIEVDCNAEEEISDS